jgi:hypothetical protein
VHGACAGPRALCSIASRWVVNWSGLLNDGRTCYRFVTTLTNASACVRDICRRHCVSSLYQVLTTRSLYGAGVHGASSTVLDLTSGATSSTAAAPPAVDPRRISPVKLRRPTASASAAGLSKLAMVSTSPGGQLEGSTGAQQGLGAAASQLAATTSGDLTGAPGTGGIGQGGVQPSEVPPQMFSFGADPKPSTTAKPVTSPTPMFTFGK